MPSETDTPTADPPTPPAATTPPAGPSKDEVKGWVREAMAEAFAGKKDAEPSVDLSTDKKVEEFVERITRQAVADIRKAEEEEGKTPPDSVPDPKHEAESEPESKKTVSQVLRKALFGDG